MEFMIVDSHCSPRHVCFPRKSYIDYKSFRVHHLTPGETGGQSGCCFFFGKEKMFQIYASQLTFFHSLPGFVKMLHYWYF